MPSIITRSLEFDAGHRVLGHESKCANLHGHRYCVCLRVLGSELDALGRVIDFSVLKSKVGGWIDDNLDHTMLLHPDDPLLKLPSVALAALFPERKPFLMPAHYPNPTAENIARLIYERSRQLLDDTDIEVYDVTVHETPNCSAEYTADFT